MAQCCAYDTVKYVHIRDARLGVLRYLLLIFIAAYVGIYEMWAKGGWLEPVPVSGAVRFSLQQPTVDDCYPALTNCSNAFARLSSLPYCDQYGVGGGDGTGRIVVVVLRERLPLRDIREHQRPDHIGELHRHHHPCVDDRPDPRLRRIHRRRRRYGRRRRIDD